LGQRTAKRKTLSQGCLLRFNIYHEDNEVKEVFFSLRSFMGDNKVSMDLVFLNLLTKSASGMNLQNRK